MEGFRIDLKTFLGLAMPNQWSQTVRKQISSWFWGDNLGPKSPNLHDPYTTVLYDYSWEDTSTVCVMCCLKKTLFLGST